MKKSDLIPLTFDTIKHMRVIDVMKFEIYFIHPTTERIRKGYIYTIGHRRVSVLDSSGTLYAFNWEEIYNV